MMERRGIMTIAERFMNNQITLNEAREAIGFPPDPVLGSKFYFQLVGIIPPREMKANIEEDAEWIRLFERIIKKQQQAEEAFIPLWKAFVREWKREVFREAKSDKELNKLVNRARVWIHRRKQKLYKLHYEMAEQLTRQAMEDALEACQMVGIQASFNYSKWAKTQLTALSHQWAYDLTERYRKRINELYRQAKKEGWNEYKLGDELRAVMNRAEKRGTTIAEHETVQMTNRLLQEVYKANGIKMKKWFAKHDSKTCAFCRSMDGRTVLMQEAFVPKGGQVQGVDDNGKIVTMNIDYQDIYHPPVHPRCRCMLAPVRPGEESYQRPSDQQGEVPTGDHIHNKPASSPKVKEIQEAIQAIKQTGKSPTVKQFLQIGEKIWEELQRRYEKDEKLIEWATDYAEELERLRDSDNRDGREKIKTLMTLMRREQIKHRLSLFQELRELGTNEKVKPNWNIYASPQLVEIMEEKVLPYFPTDWLKHIFKEELDVQSIPVYTPDQELGAYERMYHAIEIREDLMDNPYRVIDTLIHEMVHAAEATVPGLIEKENEIFEYLTPGEKTRTFAEINPNKYGSHPHWGEMLGRKDTFIDDYAGRVYLEDGKPFAFEHVTRGAQFLFGPMGIYPLDLFQNQKEKEWYLYGLWTLL
jgi:Phage Mu protein F like protein